MVTESGMDSKLSDMEEKDRHRRFGVSAAGDAVANRSAQTDRVEAIIEAMVIVFIAALHIAYFLLCLRRGNIDPGVDGEVYRQLAREYLASDSILGEKSRILFWTPWYVLIALVGADQLCVFVFQLGIFLLTLIAIRELGSHLGFSWPWRVLTLTAYGLYWPTFDYVIFYQYENFLAWGVTTTLWLVGLDVESLSRRWLNWFLAGIVVGLSIFAHSRVAGLLAFCALLLVTLTVYQKRFLWRLYAAFWIPALLPILLWGLRNRLLWGRWIFSSTSFGYNFYVGFNPVATGSFMPQPPYPPLDKAAELAFEFIRTHPGRAIELVLWKLLRYWEISQVSQFGPWWLLWQEWVLMPLGFVGFVIAALRVAKLVCLRRGILFDNKADASLFALVAMITYFLVFTVIFYVFTPRFRLPATPLIVILGIWLLREGWEGTKRAREERSLRTALAR